MKKIAPSLHELVEDITDSKAYLRSDGPVARKELRALLAVARAAARFNDTLVAGAKAPRIYEGDRGRLDEALARLDKVSGGKP